MIPLHEQLQELRMERDITLSDIHQKTKIRIEILEQLEAGEFDIVPGVYLRAFLREYAEAVGIDPQLVMDVFDKKRPTIHEPTSVSEAVPSPETPSDAKNIIDVPVETNASDDTEALAKNKAPRDDAKEEQLETNSDNVDIETNDTVETDPDENIATSPATADPSTQADEESQETVEAVSTDDATEDQSDENNTDEDTEEATDSTHNNILDDSDNPPEDEPVQTAMFTENTSDDLPDDIEETPDHTENSGHEPDVLINDPTSSADDATSEDITDTPEDNGVETETTDPTESAETQHSQETPEAKRSESPAESAITPKSPVTAAPGKPHKRLEIDEGNSGGMLFFVIFLIILISAAVVIVWMNRSGMF